MVKKKLVYGLAALLLTGCGLTGLMGCGNKATAEGRTEIEIVSYKKEAVGLLKGSIPFIGDLMKHMTIFILPLILQTKQ